MPQGEAKSGRLEAEISAEENMSKLEDTADTFESPSIRVLETVSFLDDSPKITVQVRLSAPNEPLHTVGVDIDRKVMRDPGALADAFRCLSDRLYYEMKNDRRRH